MNRNGLMKGLVQTGAAAALSFLPVAHATPPEITFQQSAQVVDAYDFVEVTIHVDASPALNPFLDVEVSGKFARTGGPAATVDGFCNSADGRVFSIRFMPTVPGQYSYSVTYLQGELRKEHSGSFLAVSGNRGGVVRIDP